MKIEIRSLDDRADRNDFDSGAPALDEWLERQAGQAQRKRLATVWIASPPDDPARILGYYSLAPWQIAFEECPDALRKRLPRYPIHVTLLARLAIATSAQGRGLGGVLLTDALKRTWQASKTVPVQGVIVHAMDDRAATFYRHHGFLTFPKDALHLFLPMGSVAALFSTMP
jgi:GNAT superfamily N-acetyltransferase